MRTELDQWFERRTIRRVRLLLNRVRQDDPFDEAAADAIAILERVDKAAAADAPVPLFEVDTLDAVARELAASNRANAVLRSDVVDELRDLTQKLRGM